MVEGKVIVEIKALRKIVNSQLAEVTAYLAVSGCPSGPLISFGERSLRYRWLLPPQ